ncbi:MAG: hypothetical protein SOY88_00145 [Massilioclostridium sp.]|nr:hypothetical protein [Massilioclostridium sp.]
MPKVKRKMSPFGFKVLEAMNGKPLTELAKEMGRSPQWISQALREPPLMEERRRAIAKHLGIDYENN